MIRIPADRGFHSSIRLAPQAPRGSRPEARFHEGGAPGWQVSEEPAWATGCKLLKRWSGRPGSNRRPTAWKAETLPLSYSRLAFPILPRLAAARAMPLQYGLHEMSIAASVLDALRAESALHGGARVTRAGLRIGELSGVAVESLRFCLEVLVADTDLAALGWEIEFAPWTRRCRACATVFGVIDARPECTACGSEDTEAAGGDQMELSFLELEEA
jgi:hydrogenase nickel incorporation protein HypA/HybF